MLAGATMKALKCKPSAPYASIVSINKNWNTYLELGELAGQLTTGDYDLVV